MALTRKQKIEQKLEKPIGKKKWRAAMARKEEAKSIVSASLFNLGVSPRKVRLLVDVVRGQDVSKALNFLKLDPRPSSVALRKLILSAINNWRQKFPDSRMDPEQLFVETIFVNPGPSLKRLRPAPQGRAYRVRKRSNHITLTLQMKEEQSSAN